MGKTTKCKGASEMVKKKIVVEIVTDATGEYCHASCRGIAGGWCDFFVEQLAIDRKSENFKTKFIRCAECKAKEAK